MEFPDLTVLTVLAGGLALTLALAAMAAPRRGVSAMMPADDDGHEDTHAHGRRRGFFRRGRHPRPRWSSRRRNPAHIEKAVALYLRLDGHQRGLFAALIEAAQRVRPPAAAAPAGKASQTAIEAFDVFADSLTSAQAAMTETRTALEAFYAALSDAQKAKLDAHIARRAARSAASPRH